MGNYTKNGYKTEFTCIVCGKPSTGRKTKKYCSLECCRKAERGSIKLSDLCPGTLGAMNEYKAAIDLIDRGFEVYKAMSPNSSCDLIALKNEKIHTIEVRTAYKHLTTGKLAYRSHGIKAEYLALVTPKSIEYIPELFEVSIKPSQDYGTI